ncbi:TlpA disulfide reductase family protein [Maribacter hydrothermalis]|uniref:Thioredoxin n=1 Tax=Maribacter hydrothermalis TaxID=1836467 RepID=A0A1B7Z880_9FLAO|nr:TlpA disulfide reductase family protein [Maribacter hydrothermalis]APQ19096.1 thioredoxin [Maribacter hydrothermalis]OBR38892.1 thioredoxin [Maribacter hydrothermalis]
MKNSILILLTGVVMFSCNTTPEGFTLNGNLRGEIPDGTQVFLKKIGENNQPIEVDTAITANGDFTFTGKSEIPELHYLFVEQLPGYTAVILENGEIQFSAQRDSMGFADISGTFQNDTFADYMEQSREISKQAQSIQKDMQAASGEAALALQDEMKELQEEYKTFELDYVKTHPKALISALVLDRAVATKAVGIEEVEEIYKTLSEEIKNSKPGKQILEGIEKLKASEAAGKNSSIGAKAPDFSGPSPDGNVIALKDVMGKVTLIDFWAGWCRPCRAENPNIVAVYNKYHDKGLNVLGVSLDRTEEAWKKAIEEDGLVWNHISNIAYFDDQIAKLYNVDAIPAAFLLDENGVIVAKNLRGPELEAKVAELLD